MRNVRVVYLLGCGRDIDRDRGVSFQVVWKPVSSGGDRSSGPREVGPLLGRFVRCAGGNGRCLPARGLAHIPRLRWRRLGELAGDRTVPAAWHLLAMTPRPCR